MEIFSEVTKKENLSLALGFFDGVHIGHQKVLLSAVNYAKEHGLKSAVITFKNHPFCYLKKVAPKYILTEAERRNKIAEIGIDYLFELDFEKIVSMSADEYLKNIIVKNFSPKAISTGFNHNFGKEKTGDTKFLEDNSLKYGYKYFVIEPQKIEHELISSTQIRKYLKEGNLKKANKMLGYKFKITGIVIKGKQIGRQLGFRTANILMPEKITDMPFGAYSTDITHKDKVYKGVTNYGLRPTVGETSLATIETHILDFNEDIYGDTITVEFNSMLRPEKKFASLDELKKQISEDINFIK